MTTRLSRGLNRLAGVVFPERRLFLRSDRSTRYARITPLAQVGGLVTVCAVVGWTAFATGQYFERTVTDATLRFGAEARTGARTDRLAAQQAERDTLVRRREAAEERARTATRALRGMQHRLADTTGALDAARTEVKVLRDQLAELSRARRVAENSAAGAVAALAEAQHRLDLTRAQDEGTEAAMASVNEAIRNVISERDAAAQQAAELDARVSGLMEQVDQWEDRQEKLLSRLEEAAQTSLGDLTALFERADLDLERILVETREQYSGSGGPFLPVTEAAAGADPDLRVAALVNDLERVNLLRIAADRAPFGIPAPGSRLTSSYGKRRDPINGGWAMHEGIDYAGPRGSALHATGEGVVTRVGWYGGYGRVVFIKHAFGFETRYAHLKRSLVQVGQRVGRGDKIAEMGSSGRSTGSHVHYEVRMNDRPINPTKFIEAARDVL